MPAPGRAPRAEREETTSIGNYLLSRTIGEGTFGKVKVGVHVLTGERVAVKVLEKDRIVDKGDVKRVSREIQILKHVQHPNLIHLLEVIEKPRHLYLVTEHINGGELFDYIVRNGRLAEDVGCRLFRQIMLAVDACHAMNVVHRDLKPENMMVDDELNLKLIDFGLSNTTEGELLATACGSPCYAAPEMIAGKRYNGPLADIWSLGVCLFAMLCGYLPFEDSHTPTLYRKILNGDFKLPEFLSDDAKGILSGMLTVDPAARFTTKVIYAHPWFVKSDPSPISPALTMSVDALRAALTMEIVPRVLELMEQVGFTREQTEADIRARKRNHCTATFFLLCRRKSNAPLKKLRKPEPPRADKGGAQTARGPGAAAGGEGGAPGSQSARSAGNRPWAQRAAPGTPGGPPPPPGYTPGAPGTRPRNPFSALRAAPPDFGAGPFPPMPWAPAGLGRAPPMGPALPGAAGPVRVDATLGADGQLSIRPLTPRRFAGGHAPGARQPSRHGRLHATGGPAGGNRVAEIAVFQFAPQPPQMMAEVAQSLALHRVTASPITPYSLRCERYGVTFQVEVFTAASGGTEIALTLNAGDRWIFKELGARLMETIYGGLNARGGVKPAKPPAESASAAPELPLATPGR